MQWDDNGLSISLGSETIHLDFFQIALSLGLVLLVALAAVALLTIGRRRNRKCRWQPVPESSRAPFTVWHCKSCGADAFTTDGRPPKECKRALRSSL